MTEEPRAAGRRQEQRLAQGSDTKGIVARTRSQELRSTWRVYVLDWLPVSRHGTREHVWKHFETKYAGRVRDEDVQVRSEEHLDAWTLYLRLWNVVGEWKAEQLAVDHAVRLGVQAEVVPRNSRREHVLTSYGRLKLPDATPTTPRR